MFSDEQFDQAYDDSDWNSADQTSQSTKPCPPDLIPGLLPRYSINLLVYSPHTGTMRFLLPQFDHYAGGILPFLDVGLSDQREQLGMILCARHVDEVKQQIESMALTNLLRPGAFPITKWDKTQIKDKKHHDNPAEESNYFDIIEMLLDAFLDQLKTMAGGRQPRFLIIESMHSLIPPHQPQDTRPVIDFCNTLKKFCERRKCTILGTVIASKPNEINKHYSLSHRISGTAQWGVGASCILGLEEYGRDSAYRRVTIRARASRGPVNPLWVRFGDDGRLNITPEPDPRMEGPHAKLSERLAGEDGSFLRSDFLGWGEEIGIGARTVDRWIKTAVADKLLKKEGSTTNAIYRKTAPN